MPEYLTPGVYVEETSFRSRSIEGVATSTFGMAGLTRYGPVPYFLTPPNWPRPLVMVPGPTLVTSFTEFERAFGDLGDVGDAGLADRQNYLAYAARAFFANGGRRLYVSRVFPFTTDANTGAITLAGNFAALPVGNPAVGTFRSRWPGGAGNEFAVSVTFQRSKNILIPGANGANPVLKGVLPGAAVETFAAVADIPRDVPAVAPVAGNVQVVARGADGTLGFRGAGGAVTAVPAGVGAVAHLTVTVNVRWGNQRLDSYPGLELDAVHPRALANVLQAEDPVDELSLVWFDTGSVPPASLDASALVTALLPLAAEAYLSGATEGTAVTAADIAGDVADPDDEKKAATGLAALAEVEDIAIVATPDAVRFTLDEQITATNNLIGHCEAPKSYRIGIVDPPRDSSISQVRAFRAQFDTRYAALYYPWMDILDPTARPDPGAAPASLQLPPSGFTAGIYARSDIARGVHKAPANEVVLGITGFRQNVTFDRQSVLNPEGINALRFFEGRANRVWGARTMSSDPEWKYVNVRRLFLYLEHSIDRSTQWAVFEPNNERLWASIRQSIEDFLITVWRTGALMGTKPEEAFFVRCDRTTMTQNDLDNGRMICLIGVAPTYPAEFVIFRIGQWTADAQQS
ncbi:MAG: phage tail sheath subtilisin-like domain-containing protein [Propionicimonas sp.]|uniref:phage tail sheath family protein n=1 Tax=Propionicimonas sp. TaxID=1955623 RepID=UPI003D0C11AB